MEVNEFFEHKNENQDDDGRTLLLTQLIDAIYEDMPDDERHVVLDAKRDIESGAYLGKVMRDIRIGLESYAIKGQLSPTTKLIFNNITKAAKQSSTTGSGIGMVFGTMLGGGH